MKQKKWTICLLLAMVCLTACIVLVACSEMPTGNKKVYNMSGVVFEDLTVTYDGSPHSIEISGKLPDGVSVAYLGNEHVNVGTYVVVAKFLGDDDKYEPIPDKTAILTIVENTSGLEYELNSDKSGYVVTGYKGYPSTVIIPTTLNDLPVTAIGWYAFSGCSSLTSITIPASVTFIDEGAFSGCSIESVYITDLVAWCNITFYDKPYQDNLYLNGEIIAGDIVFSSEIKSIPYATFRNSKITSIIIPASVTSIGFYAFSGCSSLTSIIIPDSVNNIGFEAFCDCTNLQYVYFRETTNWFRMGPSATSYIDPLFLSDPIQAAQCLRETYCEYTWFSI